RIRVGKGTLRIEPFEGLVEICLVRFNHLVLIADIQLRANETLIILNGFKRLSAFQAVVSLPTSCGLSAAATVGKPSSI
ncbi:MAG: hypothetical protein Q4P66_00800, partial [Actinomycetaceae bacterium]|nr:hypothetical protein [Actinomycetaceae bacterium]